MTDDHALRRQVEEILGTMLIPDGYRGVIRSWPPSGGGHAKVEIVPLPHACPDCLVPKSILAIVLADSLPSGVVIDAEDLTYPADN